MTLCWAGWNVSLDPPAREEDEYGVVWPLKRALYETRRAALMFQKDVIQAMVEIGFIAVTVAAQTFKHEYWQESVRQSTETISSLMEMCKRSLGQCVGSVLRAQEGCREFSMDGGRWTDAAK